MSGRTLTPVPDTRSSRLSAVERRVARWADAHLAAEPRAVEAVYVEGRTDPVRVVVVQIRPEYDPEVMRSVAELAVEIRNDPACGGLTIDPMCLPPCGPADAADCLKFLAADGAA